MSSSPRLRGIVETALYVDDLERSERFYRRLFDLEVLVADARMRALAVARGQVLLLFLKGASTQATEIPGGTIPPSDGSGQLHVAFAIDREDLAGWEARLRAAQIGIESRVEWERGGVSVYFRDPDGHAIELVTPGCWSVY